MLQLPYSLLLKLWKPGWHACDAPKEFRLWLDVLDHALH